MKSKNSRLFLQASTEPGFIILLRVLIVIAVIQLIGALIVLAPRFVSTVASQLAKHTKSNETVLLATNKNKDVTTLEEINSKKTSPLLKSSEPSTEELILTQKNSSSTASSGYDGTLQQGASLGIINVQHTISIEGEQLLKIAIKSRPHEVISVPDVKVQVYFYDELDGAIVPSKSQVASRWLNPPVDWKNADPELLEVIYQPDTNNPDVHYVGYIVAIYYKGELQGYRANPVNLTTQFPIKVYIGGNDL